jgi:hypothetical protein
MGNGDERGATMTQNEGQITIRALGEEDRESVVRLAQLDTAPTPEGGLLGAVVDGRLVAAVSLADGHSVANPFVSSEHARSVLMRRARQLTRKRGRLLPLRRRARGAVGVGTPGSGGRVLGNPRRAA